MWKQFIILFVFSIILHILSHSYQYSYTPSATNADKEDLQFVQVQLEGNSFNYPYKSWRLFIPFRRLYIYSRFPIFYWIPIYVREHSISQYAFAMCMQEVFRPRAQNVKMPEISDIQRCLCLNNDNKQQPTSNLIIILFESLESWVFENNQIEIAPNIASILLENHVLYCPFIKSQVRQGTSGDGQMTVNTGLLATQVGAACILYDNNTYPNYAHFYDSTYIFNPAPSSWKQDKATHNYGYKKLIQRNSIKWEDDASTLRKLDSILQQKPTSLCALAITINSHTPFEMVPIHPAFTELNTPKYVKKYMSCVHYTDSCLGKLINGIKTNPELKNTTIVITGDHTIFKSAMLDEFRKQKGEIDLPKMSFVPLIIYSPNIENNVCVEDTCYQMDIYPTIMHLIGCENYYWKGLGVNLLDTTARKNRSINEKEAFALSDMLIRSNYFATIEQ